MYSRLNFFFIKIFRMFDAFIGMAYELVYEKTMQNLRFRPKVRLENQIYIICVLKSNM